MEREGNTIVFKSEPRFWKKEKDSRKSNTVRKLPLTKEGCIEGFEDQLPTHIKIVNVITKEDFVRELTDISLFNGRVIFSWKAPVFMWECESCPTGKVCRCYSTVDPYRCLSEMDLPEDELEAPAEWSKVDY